MFEELSEENFSEINVERKKARTKEQIMALDRVGDRTKKLAFVVPVTYSEFNNKFSYTIELKGMWFLFINGLRSVTYC